MEKETNQMLFSLIKCQKNDIQMLNHKNSKIYRYCEPVHIQNIGKNDRDNLNPQQNSTIIDQNHLISKAMKLQAGYVYEKQFMTMEDAVKQRIKIKDHENDYFTQQQLMNSFEQLIEFVHDQKFRYGCFRLQNILIDMEGLIKLKDPIIASRQLYQSDLKSLGVMMLKCSTLAQKLEDINEQFTLQKVVKQLKEYSCEWIAKVWCCLTQVNYKKTVDCKSYQTLIEKIYKLKQGKLYQNKQSRMISNNNTTQANKNNKIHSMTKASNQNQNNHNSTMKLKSKKQSCGFRNRKIVIPALSLLDKNKNKPITDVQARKTTNNKFVCTISDKKQLKFK